LSFSEKLKVLFFDLFPEDKIINIEKKTIINNPIKEEKNINNHSTKEKEDFRVPFFNDDKEDVKTNF
jgi:hypothetical protein